ncbi:MAG: hypothetical protein NTW19_19155 [Planctomycetota bacterium]|nr:hypothetical protein [Planctomycetota bacterium]
MTSSAATTSSGSPAAKASAPGAVSAASASATTSVQRPKATLTPAEQALLDQARAGRTPRLVSPTGARVDVGLWFRSGRVWIAAFDGGAVTLFAAGPRPFVQSAQPHELTTSFYSHLSGELVCVPAPELTVRSLPMGPSDGWKFLDVIHNGKPAVGGGQSASASAAASAANAAKPAAPAASV